jgi:hypothetical protein
MDVDAACLELSEAIVVTISARHAGLFPAGHPARSSRAGLACQGRSW